MIPGPADLKIQQGDDFSYFFRIRNKNPDGTAGDYIDFTGCTGKAQCRADYGSTTVIIEFTCTLADQVAFTGGWFVTADHTQTSAPNLVVPASGGSYKWDFQVTDTNTKIKTYLQGKVTVNPEVTTP